MTKNFQAFLRLDKSKYTNEYVVIIDEKIVAAGKDIASMLKATQKKYPKKIPFVAKIPEKSVLVL